MKEEEREKQRNKKRTSFNMIYYRYMLFCMNAKIDRFKFHVTQSTNGEKRATTTTATKTEWNEIISHARTGKGITEWTITKKKGKKAEREKEKNVYWKERKERMKWKKKMLKKIRLDVNMLSHAFANVAIFICFVCISTQRVRHKLKRNERNKKKQKKRGGINSSNSTSKKKIFIMHGICILIRI